MPLYLLSSHGVGRDVGGSPFTTQYVVSYWGCGSSAGMERTLGETMDDMGACPTLVSNPALAYDIEVAG